MERNTLIALVLIGLVLLLWPVYMKKIVGENPQPVVERTEAVQENEMGRSRRAEQPAMRSEPESVPVRPAASIAPAALIDADKPDTMIVLNTRLYRGVLSSLGGGTIVSWKLKKHFLPREKDQPKNTRRELVDLIPDSAKGNLGLIMGSGLDLRYVNFQLEEHSTTVEALDTLQTIRFSRSLESGARVEKIFMISSNLYHVNMQVRIYSPDRNQTGSDYQVVWSSGLSPTERRISDDMPYYQAFALQGGEMLKTKGNGTGLREGETQWVSLRTKYFLMSLIAENPVGRAAELSGQKINIRTKEGNQEWKTFETRITVPRPSQSEAAGQFTVYLGPMDYPTLKGMNAKFEKMMNFGMVIIRPFSIAFFYTLQFLNNLVGNYGWAIIIFSILIKIALFPLTHKSYESMRSMQELQPEIAKLKEKFKKDPQKLNQATMKMYKEKGVNPMGGCLPLVFQMPVLFALFNLFRTTIMLRQASFLGGLIPDLSAPDGIIGGTINVLPILMGLTMIIQQKLSTQNPQQKAMAYLMPVFLLFIFYKLSAGLNLYYFMFNILTISQELLIKRRKQRTE